MCGSQPFAEQGRHKNLKSDQALPLIIPSEEDIPRTQSSSREEKMPLAVLFIIIKTVNAQATHSMGFAKQT